MYFISQALIAISINKSYTVKIHLLRRQVLGMKSMQISW